MYFCFFNTGVKSYENSLMTAYQSFKKYLEEYGHKHFSAIFTTSMSGAIAATRCFREAGIKVPEEVSIIAFSGESGICDFLYPRLTNISVRLDNYCSIAIDVLEKMLKDPLYKQNKILLPVQLNHGDSVMPCNG